MQEGEFQFQVQLWNRPARRDWNDQLHSLRPHLPKTFQYFSCYIDQSANDYSQLNEDQIKELVQNLVGEEFRFNIENKNNRLIIRALERECKGNFSSPPSEQV